MQMLSIYIGVSHSYTKQGGTLVSYVLTSNNNLFQPLDTSAVGLIMPRWRVITIHIVIVRTSGP